MATLLALVAVLLVRDTPEQVGQARDGAAPAWPSAEAALRGAGEWRAAHAVRTSQFALLLGCGLAYAMPWSALVTHLPLLFDDAGYAPAAVAGFLSAMVLCSSGGRLLGAAGDWLPPQYVLAGALAVEGLGAGLVLAAEQPAVAGVAVTLVGLGFGVAYTSVPVVFSHFFGRRSFSVTAGLRLTLTGAFASLAPWLSGELFDATGSYTAPFLGLMAVGLAGAACASALRHPGAPPLPVA